MEPNDQAYNVTLKFLGEYLRRELFAIKLISENFNSAFTKITDCTGK